MLDLAGLIIEFIVDVLVAPRHQPPSDQLTVLGDINPQGLEPSGTSQAPSGMLSPRRSGQ